MLIDLVRILLSAGQAFGTDGENEEVEEAVFPMRIQLSGFLFSIKNHENLWSSMHVFNLLLALVHQSNQFSLL